MPTASKLVAGPPAERASILVVDDRPDKRLAIATVLEDLGQQLVMAGSGEEALKQVLLHDFAVILMDVNMPGLDGLETAELVRKRRKSAHTPIIFITAEFHDEAHTAQGYRLGAVDYIPSPVVPEILRAKVKVMVDLYLHARAAERRVLEHLALAEERAARLAAERATQRLAFAARASATLGASLDVAETMREIGRLAVPHLADASFVTFAAPDVLVPCPPHVALRDAGGSVVSRPLGEAPHASIDRLVGAATRSGMPQRWPGPADAEADEPGVVFGEGQVAKSVIVVPLAVRGRTLAVLALGMTGERAFEPDAASVAGDLADRAATALDNALLYQKIQEADQRKNEFLAMLAHELRNPLAPIANAVHVLKSVAHDPEKVAWARDVIGRQVGQLKRLVDDLLDLSRITRGRIELKLETLDVGAVVAAAVETCRPMIEAHRHTLSLTLPSGPLAVRGDAARFAQVLGNLINNAAKYTDPGGRIDVSVDREGDDAVFRVRDTGAGIPRHALAAVFEPFMQLERTLDRSQGGLGIGLTLVRRLVEMQGGAVAARSDGPGQGSEFVVRLPAVAPAAPAVDVRDGVAEAPDHGGLTVLVVDDNADVAESTAILLRSAGCDVYVAGDGKAALAKFDSLRPDAVLLDIGLPGMDGYQVAARMRERPEHRGTLIVAVSGYGQDEHQARSRAAGVDHHLVKPIDPAVVMTLLAGRAMVRPPATSDEGR
ncbi:MAG TPA: response regulator [Casimicrobiaceae bacterium]|nr:response regulator [Casimicrobiaceae bacterium]